MARTRSSRAPLAMRTPCGGTAADDCGGPYGVAHRDRVARGIRNATPHDTTTPPAHRLGDAARRFGARPGRARGDTSPPGPPAHFDASARALPHRVPCPSQNRGTRPTRRGPALGATNPRIRSQFFGAVNYAGTIPLTHPQFGIQSGCRSTPYRLRGVPNGACKSADMRPQVVDSAIKCRVSPASIPACGPAPPPQSDGGLLQRGGDPPIRLRGAHHRGVTGLPRKVTIGIREHHLAHVQRLLVGAQPPSCHCEVCERPIWNGTEFNGKVRHKRIAACAVLEAFAVTNPLRGIVEQVVQELVRKATHCEFRVAERGREANRVPDGPLADRAIERRQDYAPSHPGDGLHDVGAIASEILLDLCLR